MVVGPPCPEGALWGEGGLREGLRREPAGRRSQSEEGGGADQHRAGGEGGKAGPCCFTACAGEGAHREEARPWEGSCMLMREGGGPLCGGSLDHARFPPCLAAAICPPGTCPPSEGLQTLIHLPALIQAQRGPGTWRWSLAGEASPPPQLIPARHPG